MRVKGKGKPYDVMRVKNEVIYCVYFISTISKLLHFIA